MSSQICPSSSTFIFFETAANVGQYQLIVPSADTNTTSSLSKANGAGAEVLKNSAAGAGFRLRVLSTF